ncbi:MAG: histidine phosphatase family protein [Legionella sp.]
MTKTKLLIARHGNTFGPDDTVTRLGKTDRPLVESGLKQGYQLGLYLKAYHLIPDIIFVSELKRTQQTAEQIMCAIQMDIPMQILSIFNEIDYGIDDNQPEEMIIARIGANALKAWDEQAIVPPGWLFEPQMIIRNWDLFARNLLKEFSGKIILVVTSNGIARYSPYITGNFKEFNRNYKLKISTGALCLFENEAPDDLWQCRAWNLNPV